MTQRHRFLFGRPLLEWFLVFIFLTLSVDTQAEKKPATGPDRFDVRIESCGYTKGIDGPEFQVTADIRNLGTKFEAPLVIWLLYDNRVCTRKIINRPIKKGQFLFSDKSDGRRFSCRVDSMNMENKPKTFKFASTWGNKDPLQSGMILFWGTTEKFCQAKSQP